MENLGYSNIFQNCMENLLLAEEQIKEKSSATSKQPVLSLEKFWQEIDTVSKKLSFECTKLCISVTTTPLPTSDETSALLQGIELAALAIVSVVFKADSCFGKTLHDNIVESAVSVIQSTRQLIRIIKESGGTGVNERYRQATGIVWEGCNALENCSKNNKDAVLTHLKSQSSMVNDAFDEINDALKTDGKGWDPFSPSSDDEEEPRWREEDKILINPTVNIIKAAKILYNKVIAAVEENGLCNSTEDIAELDQLLEDCKPISETIDNLILEIYPPLNVANMELQSQALASQLMTALKTCSKSHMVTEDMQPNIEFVQKAVEHNLNKMKDVLKTS